jgi:hypothetical protein
MKDGTKNAGVGFGFIVISPDSTSTKKTGSAIRQACLPWGQRKTCGGWSAGGEQPRLSTDRGSGTAPL